MIARKKEFNELLNLFIKGYTFNIRAKEKFVLCSPMVFNDSFLTIQIFLHLDF
jgi:hypothetical protein